MNKRVPPQLIINLAVLLALLPTGTVGAGDSKPEVWDNHEVLDKEGKYALYWSVRSDTIVFRVTVATLGWVGFGLSPRGTIVDSDVVFGWVEKGKGYLSDYHINSKGKLELDKQQNWKLTSASENKTHTTLEFSRQLDTCDRDDIAIVNGTNSVIFGYSSEDPKSPESFNGTMLDFPKTWHVKYLTLLQARIVTKPLPKDVLFWDVRAANPVIPGFVPGYAYCRFFRRPDLKKKHQIVQVKPILNPKNKVHLQYFALFQCATVVGPGIEAAVASNGTGCQSPEIAQLFPRCLTFKALWANGNKGTFYPPQAGSPIGGDSHMYYMLYNHYVNLPLGDDFVDDSGLRIYYTPQLRKYDSAILDVSLVHSPLGVIPPGQKEFIIAAHGVPECLSQGIPKEGIKIFIVEFFAEMIATKFKLRHFRGKKELPPVAEKDNFNVAYADFQYLAKEVTVLRGDQLTLECSYNSKGRNTTTFISIELPGELCVSFLWYYPATSISRSNSQPKLETIANLTGMDLSTGLYNVTTIGGLAAQASPAYLRYLTNFNWNQLNREKVQKVIRYSPQDTYCFTTEEEQIPVPDGSYPDLKYEYMPPKLCPNPASYKKKYNPN